MANTKIKKQKTHKLYVSDINPGLTDLSIEKKKKSKQGKHRKKKKERGPNPVHSLNAYILTNFRC